jgi:hypothetical protein
MLAKNLKMDKIINQAIAKIVNNRQNKTHMKNIKWVKYKCHGEMHIRSLINIYIYLSKVCNVPGILRELGLSH